MSLFPAYSGLQESGNSSKTSESSYNDWLKNSSFAIPLPAEPQTADGIKPSETTTQENDSNFQEGGHSKLKKVKHHREETDKKHKSKRHNKEYRKIHHPNKKSLKTCIQEDSAKYYIDKSQERNFLKVPTIYRPARPLYKAGKCILGKLTVRQKDKKLPQKYRFFNQMIEILRNNTSKSESGNQYSGPDDDSDTERNMLFQEEISKKTEEFSKILSEQPENISKWLEYTDFQDTVWKSELYTWKVSNAATTKAITEKKIAILDKALTKNYNDLLLRKKFELAEQIVPTDVLLQQLSVLIGKHPENLTLWQIYIRTKQCCMSLCNVTNIMTEYGNCMQKLHFIRRGATAPVVKKMEGAMISLLFECGIFLRQAGLWEQLWTLLKMHLDLNAPTSNGEHLLDMPGVSEDIVASEEETIMKSLLPLPVLWTRVENLRERTHWLPWNSSDSCSDPQRLVFADDVSDLLHPITTPSLNVKIITTVLMLLKIPLLPPSHTLFSYFGLLNVPWNLDSVELILPLYYSNVLDDESVTFLNKKDLKFLFGPQYLINKTGQKEYLDFVLHVFKSCISRLSGTARIAISVWWLRFESYLLTLNKLGLCDLDSKWKKTVKNNIKNFLKQEENRSVYILYKEYSLVERVLSDESSACKILRSAIGVHNSEIPIIGIVNYLDKTGLCSLYRSLCELLIKRSVKESEEFKQQAVSVLVSLSLGLPLKNVTTTAEQIRLASEKFKHISTELLGSVESEHEILDDSSLFLSDFTIDWISCYAWLLYLTNSVWAAGTVLENALDKISGNNCFPMWKYRRENIYHIYVTILHFNTKQMQGTYSVVKEVLLRALEEFPSNLYFLSTLADIEESVSFAGSSWWKITRNFASPEYFVLQVFLIFLIKHHAQKQEEDAISLFSLGGPVVPDLSNMNRLTSLLNRMLKSPITRRCPLLWHLHLHILSCRSSDEGAYKQAFYQSVEECPWVKVLYVEAVQLLPKELPQIQDLIIEKELRLHILPEELDILRAELQ